MFFQTFSTFLGVPGMYLEDIFVEPKWRRQGLGRQLLAHLARIAVERGYGRVEWSVLDWNEPAIGFYTDARRAPDGRVDLPADGRVAPEACTEVVRTLRSAHGRPEGLHYSCWTAASTSSA